MNIGSFSDDQRTTPLTEVVQTMGVYPASGDAGVAATDEDMGLVRTFACNYAPGGELADGQTFNIQQNLAPFSILGTNYGGDGKSTFGLPNFQGTVPMAANGQPGRTTGTDAVQVSSNQLPPNAGGQSLPVTTQQTSQAITYVICTTGGTSGSQAFLGEVLPYLGTPSRVPDGFQVADGSVLSVAANPALFAVIGATYGGNGATTFALPNLVGRDIVGAGGSSALGAVVGHSTLTLANANSPVAYGGQETPFNNQSPGLALNYIICTQGVFPVRDNEGKDLGSNAILSEIKAFAGPVSAIPRGWALCAGQLLSINQNTALFSLLGTTYGGDGRTTFALPNLEDSVVSGAGTQNGTSYSVGDPFGSDTTTLSVTCFASGTLIRTARGDVAVEALEIGDLAVTASGESRPIRWLGHRKLDCGSHPDRAVALPIRVTAHAFGPNKPARDLFVSSAHSICIDVVGEVLIPAASLINGSTIAQVEVGSVTYWHVELDSHDILLANGLPCESYLDCGNRGFFVESGVVDLALGPDAAATLAEFCRPFQQDGPLVDVVRSQLRARAAALGWALDGSDAFAALHLVVEGERVDPVTRGLSARFTVPAGARDVWLVSSTSRPCDIDLSDDARDLGICLRGLTVDDGFSARAIDLADPLLHVGIYDLENGTHRWTAGRTRLPAASWAHCAEGFFLKVDLAVPALARWVGPVATTDIVPIGHRSRPRLVAPRLVA